MKKVIFSNLIIFLLLLSVSSIAYAQDYYFRLDEETVHVYWNEDGSMSLDYVMIFYNDPNGHPIEYVDLGLPNNHFDGSSITADVNGNRLTYISASEFQGSGTAGVAVGLGNYAIPPGRSGTVHIQVGKIKQVLFTDDEDENYASAVFSPALFISSVIYGSTDMVVTFHFPPGVKPEEPRWHTSPSGGWPSEPVASLDSEGRIIYIWHNLDANGHTKYDFGVSFPNSYVPAGTVASPPSPSLSEQLGIDPDVLIGCASFGAFAGFFALIIWISVASERRRKLKYLPPKIKIEGHGIKRGLTAIEAAVLMEQPMDKILTMVLFSVIKKGAAEVTSRDPIKLRVIEPLPDELHPYEQKFLEAFRKTDKRKRTRGLQEMTIQLIKSVGKKMKGFSHKETVRYYRKIMEKAWAQVEEAQTPEIKSKAFDEHLGWTMLDRDFDDRTQEVFRTGPVFVPMWWHRYDPGWSGPKVSPKISPTSVGSGRSSPSLPHLPGGEFAASIVTGVQGFAGNVVGNVTKFTSGITNKTNPVPKPTSRSGGWSGGGGCACACACAGCACACAGGGR